jgi:hypothetical protein
VRTCYDSVNSHGVPPLTAPFGGDPLNGDAYLGYKNGRWPTYGDFEVFFPTKINLSITVFAIGPGSDADGCDCENGDLTAAQTPAWVNMRRQAQARIAFVYCSRLGDGTTGWQAVKTAFAHAGIAEPPYAIADYTNAAHLLPGTILTQWADRGPYDISAMADSIPGIDIPGGNVQPTDIVDAYVPAPGTPDAGSAWQMTEQGGVLTFIGGRFYGSYLGLPPQAGTRVFYAISGRFDGKPGYIEWGNDGSHYQFGPAMAEDGLEIKGKAEWVNHLGHRGVIDVTSTHGA